MKEAKDALGFVAALIVMIAVSRLTENIPYSRYLWYALAVLFSVLWIVRIRRWNRRKDNNSQGPLS